MFFARHRGASIVAAASLVALASGGSGLHADIRQGGTAGISGVVTAAEPPHAPIARARVILTSERLAQPRVTISGLDGRYQFEQLPAGSYSVSANATGYAAHSFNELTRSAPPPAVALSDGQRVTSAEIRLPAAGVIAGTILDEDARPFAGASVEALVPRGGGSLSSLVAVATATSDDRGEFRIAGLPRGAYFVRASDPAFSNAGDDSGVLKFPPTYYPGASAAAQATRVEVTPGAKPSPIRLGLRIVRPARISGRIATPDNRVLINAVLIMTAVGDDALASIPPDDVTIRADGTFAFRNVPPGRYRIRARAEVERDTVAHFGAFELVVDGRDIDRANLDLAPGGILEGAVSFESIGTPPPRGYSGLRVRAPLADGSSFGEALTGAVTADGTYRIRGLTAGAHFLTVEGIQTPWVLKSILWRGQDLTDVPIQIEGRQTFTDVRITLTDAATDVSGAVRERSGAAAGGAVVVAVPVATQYWTHPSRRVAVTRTTPAGTYRIRGLPPAEYRLVATTEFDEQEVRRPERLQEFLRAGSTLILGEREARSLDLTLYSAAPPGSSGN